MLARAPSDRLAVDANIFLGALLGFKSKGLIEHISNYRALVTSMNVWREVTTMLHKLHVVPERMEAAEIMFSFVFIADEGTSVEMEAAATILTNAIASRNASANDAHLLAVAWAHEADIWSHDRDFAGTGWPSWSSANLLAALVTT
jgi:predicted nucleic acid-binding protein